MSANNDAEKFRKDIAAITFAFNPSAIQELNKMVAGMAAIVRQGMEVAQKTAAAIALVAATSPQVRQSIAEMATAIQSIAQQSTRSLAQTANSIAAGLRAQPLSPELKLALSQIVNIRVALAPLDSDLIQ